MGGLFCSPGFSFRKVSPLKATVDAMMDLFDGLDRAYGTYLVNSTEQRASGKKVVGKVVTVQGVVNYDLWLSHLIGDQGIGIVPIKDNSCCRFGAIDIDVYTGLDVPKIVSEITRNGYPVMPVRSKSGGLHLYLFTNEDVPATLIKEKLQMIAAALKHGDAEIFPKQSEILSERGDIGQWINMPYENYLSTARYCFASDGITALPIDVFISKAKSIRLSKKELELYSIKLAEDISDGPPCLQTLITKGFPAGSRNDGLFNLAIYLKKRDPGNWESQLDTANQKHCMPALSSSEITMIVNSMKKKDYNYACSKSPLKGCCNMPLCRAREYGIGGLIGMPELTGLTKYDSNPPIWFIDVEGGGRMELCTEDLQIQSRFQRKCMEHLNQMPPPIKPPIWQAIVQKLLENVTIIEAPTDASPKGIMFEYLEKFCTGRAQAKDEDEILLGRPYTIDGYHWFRMLDFAQFLERNRFKELKQNAICAMIRDIGGDNRFLNIKGKGVHVWVIKEFKQQIDSFKTPEIKEEQHF